MTELYFIGDVNEENVKKLFEQVLEIHKVGPREEIVLYITSHGGNPQLAFAFYDLVRVKGINLTTIVLGSADSSALIILLAGQTRKASVNSLFLLHNISREWEKISFDEDEIAATSADITKVQRLVDELLAIRTGHKLADVQERRRSRVSLTAVEAFEWGLIKEII